MKKSTTNFETTITISKETRDTLKKIKQETDYRTYDEIISDLLSAKQGYIKDYEVITAPKTAMVLNHIVLDDKGVQLQHYELPITYKQLKDASIGQYFTPNKTHAKYYTHEAAQVVWKDNDFVVLRVFEEVMQDELSTYNRLVGVELL